MKQEKSPTIVPDLGVLVVDMQNYYIRNLPNKEELIRQHISLLGYCAKHDIPVVNIEYLNSCNQGPTVEPIIKAMKPIRRKYQLSKKRMNAFYHQRLPQKLLEWDISTVFITGTAYPSCVYETARGAWREGFAIMSAKNIVGCYEEFDNDAFKKVGGFFEDFREAFPLLE